MIPPTTLPSDFVKVNFAEGSFKPVTTMPVNLKIEPNAIPIVFTVNAPVDTGMDFGKIGWVGLVVLAITVKPPWEWFKKKGTQT